MNEQIKELSKEAEQWCYENLVMPTPAEWNDKLFARFAELIVKECINVSEEHAKNLESHPRSLTPELELYEDGIVNGIYEATAAIKEHFGIKE